MFLGVVPRTAVYRVGARSTVINIESSTEETSATENRWQTLLAVLSTKVTGTNIVERIIVTLISVCRTRFTDPRAVLPGGSPLLVTICLMPLIIMTVLLISNFTVSITLNTANAPTAKLIVDKTVNALRTIIGMVTAGTTAVWKPRKNRHTIRKMRTTVLISAPKILRTETLTNGAALQGQIAPRSVGKQVDKWPSLLPIVCEALRVPVLAVSPTVTLVVGPLPQCVMAEQLLVLSLMWVILCSSIRELLRRIPNRTPLNLLGARRCARITTEVPSRRLVVRGTLFSRLLETRPPRIPTRETILEGIRPHPPSPRGLS